MCSVDTFPLEHLEKEKKNKKTAIVDKFKTENMKYKISVRLV